jgi:hypothetical protein
MGSVVSLLLAIVSLSGVIDLVGSTLVQVLGFGKVDARRGGNADLAVYY